MTSARSRSKTSRPKTPAHISVETSTPAGSDAMRLALAVETRTVAVYVARSGRRAEEVANALDCLAPDTRVLIYPAWDCLPFDRVPPSREVMGRRVEVLRELSAPSTQIRIVITSIDAILGRTPPAAVVSQTAITLCEGQSIDRGQLRTFVESVGYGLDDRVDEAGEIAFLNSVIDVYPPADKYPTRIFVNDDRIETLRHYDPVTQRTDDTVERVTLGAASELCLLDEAGISEEIDRTHSIEYRLISAYHEPATFFDFIPGACLLLEDGMNESVADTLGLIAEAEKSRLELSDKAAAPACKFYLTRSELEARLASFDRIDADHAAVSAVPSFFESARFGRAFGDFVKTQLDLKSTVLVCGTSTDLSKARAILERHGLPQPQAADWRDIIASKRGGIFEMTCNLAAGFVDRERGLAVIATSDIFGRPAEEGQDTVSDNLIAAPELRLGDVVIHEDHGLGVLRSLESVTIDGRAMDTVRLEYHGGTSLMAQVEEFGRIWRYGAVEDAVTLDRLNTDAWSKRRAKAGKEIEVTAQALSRLAKARAEGNAAVITPPRAAFAKFVSRFAYSETTHQAATAAAVLADLASGRQMNRLICGDVGFGKTEIALRAAAAVALCKHQVAVIAPTTVLARQHYEVFKQRFAGSGIEIAHLSRVTNAADAKSLKGKLESGDVGIVIGTQALVSKDMPFADLALVIVDEEHRFGTKMKQSMRELAPNLHFLAMSATPIPRTLQSALVGVQDVSLIAAPPAKRRPIRTFLAPFDEASVKTALMREHRRGGQSFFVVPRIKDVDPIQARLRKLVPSLSVTVMHGDVEAAIMDERMAAFGAGRHDILLATNIIESGLDVPGANTMFIWRPDRFGLAQLHQLRGRVGRGNRQGLVFFLTDPAGEISEATRARLSTLVAFDRLGAGFAISARDLDLRGAGDILGEDQAGHVKMIGVGLYQHLLAQAVQRGASKHRPAPGGPKINLELSGSIPDSFVAEPAVRLNLYSRLQKMSGTADVDAFELELDDRFGSLPDEVSVLLQLRRLSLLAGAAAIAKIDAGPAGIALSFCDEPDEKIWKELEMDGARRKDGRLIVPVSSEQNADRLSLDLDLVSRISETMR